MNTSSGGVGVVRTYGMQRAKSVASTAPDSATEHVHSLRDLGDRRVVTPYHQRRDADPASNEEHPLMPRPRRPATTTSRTRSPIAAPLVDPLVDPEAALRRAAESLVAPERRLERSPVLGPRAELTRRKLVDSASELFRNEGCANITVADIAKHAKVSLPTFYQYFSEINDVIAVIVVDFIMASLERGLDRWKVVSTGRAGLRRLVTAHVQTYIDDADFMELWECAKLISPKVRALSSDYRRLYIHIIEGYIQEGVDAGAVRSDLPAVQMADVIATILEYYCFEHYVLSREKPDDLEEPVHALSEMIADAIRLAPHL